MIRLVGSPLVAGLTLAERPAAVLWVGIVLVITDWLDGVLARVLHQQTALGARLDTLADVLLGLTLLFAVAWLNGDFVIRHGIAIGLMLATYTISVGFSGIKFGRWPSYHNDLAKAGMVLGSLAGVAVLSVHLGFSERWAAGLFYLAAVTIVLANIEAILITHFLRSPRSNVGSVMGLWKDPARP